MRSKRCNGWREVKFEGITKVVESLILSFSLTRNVNLNTLSYKPFILLPNAGGEFLFHLKTFYLPKAVALTKHNIAFCSLPTIRLPIVFS